MMREDDLEEQFLPDFMTPDQFADLSRPSTFTRGEQRLYEAIFYDARDCAMGSGARLNNDRQCGPQALNHRLELKQTDAVLWFMGARDCRVTFERVCLALGLDYDNARAAILKMVRPRYTGSTTWEELLFAVKRGAHAKGYNYGQPRDRDYVPGEHARPAVTLTRLGRRAVIDPDDMAESLSNGGTRPGGPNLARIAFVVRQICRRPLRHKHVIAFLGRELTNVSLNGIAKFVGLASSSDVVYAVKSVHRKMAIYQRCKDQVAACRLALGAKQVPPMLDAASP